MPDDPARKQSQGAAPEPIALDETTNIARLANLALDKDELVRMTRELGTILTYVRQLEELDVSEVGATTGGLGGAGLPPPAPSPEARSGPAGSAPDRVELRADEPSTSLPRELALREAPRTAEDGFAVPAFVDEG